MSFIPSAANIFILLHDTARDPMPVLGWTDPGASPVVPVLGAYTMQKGDALLMTDGSVYDPHLRESYSSPETWRINTEDKSRYSSAPEIIQEPGEPPLATPGRAGVTMEGKTFVNKSFWSFSDDGEMVVFTVEGGQPTPKFGKGVPVRKITRDGFFDLRRAGATEVDAVPFFAGEEPQPEQPDEEQSSDDGTDMI